MVVLVTSDNKQFIVDKEVAERSALIRSMLKGKNAVPRCPRHTLSDYFVYF